MFAARSPQSEGRWVLLILPVVFGLSEAAWLMKGPAAGEMLAADLCDPANAALSVQCAGAPGWASDDSVPYQADAGTSEGRFAGARWCADVAFRGRRNCHANHFLAEAAAKREGVDLHVQFHLHSLSSRETAKA